MKARGENLVIKTYFYESKENNKLPKVFNGHLAFRAASTKLQKQEGFFDVVTPTLQPNEKLGSIYWDEANQVFTYLIEIIPEPTQEQIEAALLIEKTNTRNILLAAGIEVANGDDIYWFNESYLNNFITATQISEKMEAPTMSWKTLDGNWKDIPISEAYIIGTIGTQMIQQIYFDN